MSSPRLSTSPDIFHAHGTTIVALRHRGVTVMAGDGQVSLDSTVIKNTARKVRRMAAGRVLTGFAGSTADAMTLFERLEAKLRDYNNNLLRAAVELSKDWRTDRYLRRLEALLLAADDEHILLISGNGDVIEPDDAVIAIGSGGGFALAAAKALLSRAPDLPAEDIARTAMQVAADICVFTNHQLTLEKLPAEASDTPQAGAGN